MSEKAVCVRRGSVRNHVYIDCHQLTLQLPSEIRETDFTIMKSASQKYNISTILHYTTKDLQD